MKTVTLRDGSHRASVFETAQLCVLWFDVLPDWLLTLTGPLRTFDGMLKPVKMGWQERPRSPISVFVPASLLLGFVRFVNSSVSLCRNDSGGKRESGEREIERHWARLSAFSCVRSGWAVIWWNALAGPRVARPPASEIPLMLSWLTMLSWNNTTHGAAVRCWQTLMEMSSPR